MLLINDASTTSFQYNPLQEPNIKSQPPDQMSQISLSQIENSSSTYGAIGRLPVKSASRAQLFADRNMTHEQLTDAKKKQSIVPGY